MNIFLIRHGESEHNKFLRESREAKRAGKPFESSIESRDLPLTLEGREHVQSALLRLPETADAFYCGSHIRTKESADIVREKYPELEYIIDERINASLCGSLDHKSFDEMHELTGIDFTREIENDTFDFHEWGGESAADVHKRVADFLREILGKDFENVIVMTSLEVIKSVYKILFSDKAPDIMRYIRAKNGTVHEFRIETGDIKKPL